MIARLRGVVIEKTLDAAIVECGGVGYEVMLSATDYGAAPLGKEVSLYIYENIREDAHNLFGFGDAASKRFFEQLLSINGVGPKVAMNVMSAASVQQLQSAIAGGDAELLRGVAGIGKKTAERIMLELKGKVQPGEGGLSTVNPFGSSDPVYMALIGLGYTAAQASEAAARIPTDVVGEQARIKAALNALS